MDIGRYIYRDATIGPGENGSSRSLYCSKRKATLLVGADGEIACYSLQRLVLMIIGIGTWFCTSRGNFFFILMRLASSLAEGMVPILISDAGTEVSHFLRLRWF